MKHFIEKMWFRIYFDYFCGMKSHALKIGSLLMALMVLFVSVGWNVNFHYCTEEDHLMSSFGDASRLCDHCQHHHHHDMNAVEFAEHNKAVHFGAKCCCEDFDSPIGFTDNYTFSPVKQLVVFFQVVTTLSPELSPIDNTESQQLIDFSPRKIPIFKSARRSLIYFSQLKLNPLFSF